MIIESIFASYEISGNIFQWCDKQLHDGAWAGTLDIAFISIIYQLNIQSVSNIVSDLRLFDSYGFFIRHTPVVGGFLFIRRKAVAIKSVI